MINSCFKLIFFLLRSFATGILVFVTIPADAQTTISLEEKSFKNSEGGFDLFPIGFLNEQSFPEGVLYKMPPLPVSASVSGNIYTEINTPIPSVTIRYAGTDAGSLITANDGAYYFNLDAEGNYSVVPTKNNDTMISNGISTIDLLLIRKHILSTNLLGSPYRIIAGDVDGSGSITTIDYLLVRSVILRINNTFPNGRIWVFVNSDFVFSNPQYPFPFQDFRTYNNIINDYLKQDFIGIKLGDVNNSWDPNTPKMTVAGEMHLAMDNANAKQGQEIIIPVKVDDFKNISGYQFTISWNPKVISLLDVNNKSLDGYYSLSRIADGYITTTWNDDRGLGISLDDNEIAFELKFKVIGNTGDHSEIKIGSELTVSEAYNENLDVLEINARNGMVKVEETSSIMNWQVSPNPFSENTSITFTIEQEEEVNILIYDLEGKKVSQIKEFYKPGKHQINWNANNAAGGALASGIYYVRIAAGKLSGETRIVRLN